MTKPQLLGADSSTKIDAQYIIVVKDSDKNKRDALIAENSTSAGFKVLHTYNIGTMIGFSAVLTPQILNKFLEDEGIDYIEFDQAVSI